MTLCPADKCSGCGACAAICPVGCISMREDAFGVSHPEIGPSCTECGLCAQTCPVLNPLPLHEPSKCYAGWNSDSEERRLSASGGVAALLARLYRGRVYGTAWSDSFMAEVKSGNAKDFKGSKYVQSYFSEDTYREIKSRLKSGEKLLFIGTPCQVAGLLNFVGDAAEGLWTADLLCHGVCPERYLTEELGHLRKGRNLTDVRFRSNDKYNFHLTLWDGDKCFYDKDQKLQPYFRAFLEGISLRENCYSCQYSKPERSGDLTLGDFIGLDGQVSSVSVNTTKGSEALKELSAKFPELQLVEHPYSDRLAYKPSIMESFKKSPLRAKFLDNYLQSGFYRAVRKTLFKDIVKSYATIAYWKIHHIGHLIKKRLLK